MAIKQRVRAVLLFFLVCALLTSAGKHDTEYPRGTIQVTGRVRLVGTALFSRMVISDEQGRDWYVENEDREKLSRLEQREVTVKGKTEYREITRPNGESAGTRRYLRDIQIIRQ